MVHMYYTCALGTTVLPSGSKCKTGAQQKDIRGGPTLSLGHNTYTALAIYNSDTTSINNGHSSNILVTTQLLHHRRYTILMQLQSIPFTSYTGKKTFSLVFPFEIKSSFNVLGLALATDESRPSVRSGDLRGFRLIAFYCTKPATIIIIIVLIIIVIVEVAIIPGQAISEESRG